MEITNPAEEFFKDGGWGHDGSQWRKLALLWGYSDVYKEAKSNTNADVGTNYLLFGAVPAGEIWIVTNAVAYNSITAGCSIALAPVVNASAVVIRYTIFITLTRYTDWQGWCVLKAGDYFRVGFYNCVAGDDIYAHVIGYKMAVS